MQYQTAKLPDANILWSPRVGFNWDVTGDRNTQVRGGTGVFTGPPAYVWISNQIGNTGVLTGFEQLDNTTARPFNPNPDAYKPATVTGAPAVELRARADRPGLQVPADLAHQHRGRPAAALGLDRHGRVPLQPRRQRHLLHQRQPAGGADGLRRRRRAPALDRATGSTASVVERHRAQEPGRRPLVERRRVAREDLPRTAVLKAAYSYGEARNTGRPGLDRLRLLDRQPASPAIRTTRPSPRPRRRVTASSWPARTASSTSSSARRPSRSSSRADTIGNASYTFSGDLNGDGGTSQRPDLHPARHVGDELPDVHVERARPSPPAEQAAAWDAYISQDKYLSKHRGQYAERNAIFLPMV